MIIWPDCRRHSRREHHRDLSSAEYCVLVRRAGIIFGSLQVAETYTNQQNARTVLMRHFVWLSLGQDPLSGYASPGLQSSLHLHPAHHSIWSRLSRTSRRNSYISIKSMLVLGICSLCWRHSITIWRFKSRNSRRHSYKEYDEAISYIKAILLIAFLSAKEGPKLRSTDP